MIVAPFLGIVVWALIIAIAPDGSFERVCSALCGPRVWAGILVVGVALLLLFSPAVLLSETLVSGAKQFSHELTEGTTQIPPPHEWVRDLPVIGSRVYDGWLRASQNLGETLMRLEPQLRTVSQWLLKAAGNVGAGLRVLLVLVAAIVQLLVLIAMVPPIVIGFSILVGPGAFALLVWCLLIGLVDNVLKPILFGRGSKVPMLVIIVGALGFELFMASLSDPAGAPSRCWSAGA